MKPELSSKVIFTDCVTNENLAVITLDKWSVDTLERMFIDIFNSDCWKNQHGFYVTYGD